MIKQLVNDWVAASSLHASTIIEYRALQITPRQLRDDIVSI
jgi:hypothetical protein